MSAPPASARCSALSAAAAEPLAGSAPQAAAWLALEQTGPWGANAFTASHLDPALGRAIETSAALAGVRPCLVRRPGRHADRAQSGPRRLLLAHTAPGSTWLLSASVIDPAVVLDLDWEALAAGDTTAVRRSLPALVPDLRPHLLVCTNGTRDVCCAVLGRPVTAQAAAERPKEVWEVTHTSGHRFAPTAVLLPHGTLHGRLDGNGALALLEAADRGQTVLEGHRGRSTWPPPGQVAELAIRKRTGECGLGALAVARDRDQWLVTHIDGRAWRVRVESVPGGAERPESCGKAAVEQHRYAVAEVSEAARRTVS